MIKMTHANLSWQPYAMISDCGNRLVMLSDRDTWPAALPVRGKNVRRLPAALAHVHTAIWERDKPHATI